MIKLLDCTLRDGGYINNWNFGSDVIKNTINKLYDSKIDIIEAGFIRDEKYDANRAVFSDLKKLDLFINTKNHSTSNSIATMAEISNPIPLDLIAPSSETNCDIIRVIVWKTKRTEEGVTIDALQESFEYCKGIAEKGYKLCVQPNRTDQYSDSEFIDMLKLFEQINPYAIYVVDSWGTMYSNQVMHYMEIADKVLSRDISLGFHGHNNMMQAFSTAEKIIEKKFERDIIIDASIDGIGRGAGNLNLELIAAYLNKVYGAEYDMASIYEIYDNYISKLRNQFEWGSSFPFILSSLNNANPNYASSFSGRMSLNEMQKAYNQMSKSEKIIYSDNVAGKYIFNNQE